MALPDGVAQSAEVTSSPAPAQAGGDVRQSPANYYIKSFRAKVVPERMRAFTMPGEGMVSNWLSENDRVPKGTIFATVNERDIEIERSELEVKLLKDRIAKEEELAKLEKQLKEIKFYNSLSREEKQFSSARQQSDKELLKSTQDKIELVRKELAILEDKPQADFAKKEEKYILRMPFDGRLQYQFNIPADNSQSLFLDSGATIATVCDDSAYYLSIIIADPDLGNLEPHTLSLIVTLADGSTLNGRFAHKRIEKTVTGTTGEVPTYFFKLPSQEHAKAHALLGSNCTAKLYFTPEQTVQCIKKLQLASHTDAKGCSSWQELLAKVHPELELIVNGETELIVRKK